MSAALSPQHRAASIARMAAEPFDIVVVGGGVTGTGAALDAATRGLSVALVEASDYAAGASSKSSKLIHGGLRYLEMLDFGLVREALTERGLLLTRLAPHLVRPVPFLWPLTHRLWERPYVGAGLLLYDTMGGRRALPRSRHLSRTRALEVAPALRPDALVGAVQFYDAQEDDARMVACLARTAAAHGAAMATRVAMVGLLPLTPSGRVTGIRVSDLLNGTDLQIGARHVVLATGAWTGAGVGSAEGELQVRPSKGVHIVVPRHRIAMDVGLLTRTEKSVLFVIPWGEHWLIGDTDTEWPYDAGHPAASRADIDYLLAKVNHTLREPLTADDIEGVFAGLRPLVVAGAGRGGAGADTTKLSREHSVDSSVPGLSVIAGGKYTTYRVMARDLIDAAVRDLAAGSGGTGTTSGSAGGVGAVGAEGAIPASRTDQVPLAGADGFAELRAAREQLASSAGLPVTQIDRLLGRYGSDVTDLFDLMARKPGLKEPVPGAGPYLGAEIVYACTHEGALGLDDVLSRRTRIRIEVRDRGAKAASHAAELMALELGWDGSRMAAEITGYHELIAADLAAESMPDDRSAFEAATRHVRGAADSARSAASPAEPTS